MKRYLVTLTADEREQLTALIATGQLNEAVALLEQAVARAHLRGLATFEAWCKAGLSVALLVAGRIPAARAAAASALDEARARGLRSVEAIALCSRARIVLASGESDARAIRRLTDAIEFAERLGMVPIATELRKDLARFALPADYDAID